MKHLRLFNTLVFLLTLFLVGCTSQKIVSQNEKQLNYIPYYLKVYEADSLYLTQNYQESFQILDKLFQEYEPLNQDILYEMETYVRICHKLGYEKKAKPILMKLIDTWGLGYQNLDEDIKSKNYISLEEVKKLEEIYQRKINWSLRDTVVSMNNNDKKIIESSNNKNRKKVDSMLNSHLNLYKAIYDKYGFIDKRDIGNSKRREITDFNVFFNHLSHTDSANYLKEKVLSCVKLGKCSPKDYAILIDRPLLEQDTTSTVFYSITINQTYTIKEQNSINKKRKEIGLPSMYYFNWRNKILSY